MEALHHAPVRPLAKLLALQLGGEAVRAPHKLPQWAVVEVLRDALDADAVVLQVVDNHRLVDLVAREAVEGIEHDHVELPVPRRFPQLGKKGALPVLRAGPHFAVDVYLGHDVALSPAVLQALLHLRNQAGALFLLLVG